MEQEEVEHDLRALESLSGDPLSLGQAAAVGRAIARLRADLERMDDSRFITVRIAASVSADGEWIAHGEFGATDERTLGLIVHRPEDALTWVTARAIRPKPQVVEVDGDTEVVNG